MSTAKLKELRARLTGISTPAGGINWKPLTSDRELARRLFSYLEDRRVLFELGEAECPDHSMQSLFRIREFLTQLLQEAEPSSEIALNLRALRAGIREFLTRLEGKGARVEDMRSHGHWASWEFLDALGKLRAGFGMHIAVIAERFDVQVPATLRPTLPPLVSTDD